MLKAAAVFSVCVVALVESYDFLHLDKACETCRGYDLKATCKTNPDITSTVDAIIEGRGYQQETHTVVTDDDIELTMFRILPKGPPKNISVLVQHGLMMDATMWVVVGNRSLGFRLSDMGYDVWLGNYRETPYSKIVDTKQHPHRFDISVDDLGLYDIPAMTEHIAGQTKRKGIIYIGHSMGGSGVMAYAAGKVDHAHEYLRGIIGLAPAVFFHLNPLLAPYRLFLDMAAPILRDVLPLWGFPAMSDNGRFTKNLAITLCTMNEFTCELCRSLVQMTGPDIEQFAPVDVPALFSYCLYANPLKIITHFLLSYKYQAFVPYEYGREVHNIYDLSKIQMPVHLMYGQHDALVSKEDVEYLYANLTTPVKSVQGIANSGTPAYNHIDFVFAKDINYAHDPLFEIIDSLSK